MAVRLAGRRPLEILRLLLPHRRRGRARRPLHASRLNPGHLLLAVSTAAIGAGMNSFSPIHSFVGSFTLGFAAMILSPVILIPFSSNNFLAILFGVSFALTSYMNPGPSGFASATGAV